MKYDKVISGDNQTVHNESASAAIGDIMELQDLDAPPMPKSNPTSSTMPSYNPPAARPRPQAVEVTRSRPQRQLPQRYYGKAFANLFGSKSIHHIPMYARVVLFVVGIGGFLLDGYMTQTSLIYPGSVWIDWAIVILLSAMQMAFWYILADASVPLAVKLLCGSSFVVNIVIDINAFFEASPPHIKPIQFAVNIIGGAMVAVIPEVFTKLAANGKIVGK